MRRGGWVDPDAGNVTLIDWLGAVEERKRIRLAPSTLEVRERLVRCYVQPYIGLYPLNRITAEVLQRWVGDLIVHEGTQTHRPLSPATIRKTYVIVAEALRLAVARGRLLADPNIEVELPSIGQSDHRYLSEPEAWKLADAIGERYRPFVLIGAFGGLRPGEIRSVQWSDLDFATRRLQVRGTKTTGARRTIRLPDHLLEELRAHRSRFPSVGHVVIRTDGTPVNLQNLRNRRFRTAVRESVGGRMRLHDLRHTHVAILIAQGVHPRVIADRLGDTIHTTLAVYGHLLDGVEDAAVERIGRRPEDPEMGGSRK